MPHIQQQLRTNPLVRVLFHAAAVAAALLFVSLALAQVPISQLGPDGVTVKGRVIDVFGAKFVIEDESGRILVEMRALPGQVPALRRGELVLVTGITRDRILDARRVARENGEEIFNDTLRAVTAPIVPEPPRGMVPSLAPYQAGLAPDRIAETLRSAGVIAVGQPVRKAKHIEIPARTAAGRDVIVSLDRLGRLWEIADAYHNHKQVSRFVVNSTSDAERALRQSGFSPLGEIERRRHHYEALATNPRGEVVEVHLDLAGYVYKQIWLR